MSWLERLRNHTAADIAPTKTTDSVLVVSVGSPSGHLEKIKTTPKVANDLN
jgi:hypothetical protein